MRHFFARGFAAAALMWLAVTPSAARACVSDTPTFAEAVNGARAIARVTVVEGFDTYIDDPSHSETYRVDRILKGDLPRRVTVAPAWTSLCHDSIGAFTREGMTIVVAFGLRSYSQDINPIWSASGGEGVWGTAGVPRGVATMADLEHAILAKLGLPDTSTIEPREAQGLPLALAFTAGLVGFGVTLRRSGDRRTREGRAAIRLARRG